MKKQQKTIRRKVLTSSRRCTSRFIDSRFVIQFQFDEQHFSLTNFPLADFSPSLVRLRQQMATNTLCSTSSTSSTSKNIRRSPEGTIINNEIYLATQRIGKFVPWSVSNRFAQIFMNWIVRISESDDFNRKSFFGSFWFAEITRTKWCGEKIHVHN